MRLIGLDLATTTGISIFDDSDTIAVATFRGNPIEQLVNLRPILEPDAVIVYESHRHFRNAKTTRSLIGLIGYIAWTLRSEGYEVYEVWPAESKKRLKDFYVDLTKDEKDAILLVQEYTKRQELFEVERIQNGKGFTNWGRWTIGPVSE